MHQHIALADHIEHVAAIAECGGHHRRIRRIAQIGHVEQGNLQQVAQFQQIVAVMHIARAERRDELGLTFAQLLKQQLPHRLRHVALHFQSNDFTKAALKHLLLDRFQQIVRLIDLPEIQVGIARDAEGEPSLHVHPRK